MLGFVVAAWIALLAILAFAPDIYARTLNPPLGQARAVEIGFLSALTVFLALMGVGVLRRWRWMFWLIVLTFLAGLLRTLASALELARVLPAGGPEWYVLFQGVIGLVQFGIGLALLRGYRKAGVWGAF